MPEAEVQEFGRQLVRLVRDSAVRSCDNLLEPQADSPTARRWRQMGISRKDLESVIPDVVDDVLFAFLHAIDEHLLRLKFVTADGREVDLAEIGRGELAGWFMGSGCWRSQFSEERFFDDTADLNVWPPPNLDRPDPPTGSSPPSSIH